MPTLNGDNVPYCGGLAEHAANSATAWGCRLIVSQDGYVDFVPDRQGAAGVNRDKFFDLLEEEFPVKSLRDEVADLLRSGKMQTRVAEEFVLHTSDKLEVRANTNASAGYCYVVAFLRPEVNL